MKCTNTLYIWNNDKNYEMTSMCTDCRSTPRRATSWGSFRITLRERETPALRIIYVHMYVYIYIYVYVYIFYFFMYICGWHMSVHIHMYGEPPVNRQPGFRRGTRRTGIRHQTNERTKSKRLVTKWNADKYTINNVYKKREKQLNVYKKEWEDNKDEERKNKGK